MFDPRWLETYEDIGAQGTVQFAVTCPICSARFLSACVEAGEDPVATASAAFKVFDAAYHAMAHTCASCGLLACVCCWDDVRQLCLRCDGGRQRGDGAVKVDAPVADGQLMLAHTGIFDTSSRPLWMQALLTVRIRSQVISDRLRRRIPSRWSVPLRSVNLGSGESSGVALLERRASTSLQVGDEQDIFCPICEAANYDFATYCRNCGARLLERCVTCGEVNAVEAERCVSCDAVLKAQQQQVVLERPATYFSPAEVRRKTYVTTTLNSVQTIERETTSPLGKKRRRGALRDALAERPVAVLREEVLANHPGSVLPEPIAPEGADEHSTHVHPMARLVWTWSHLRLALRSVGESLVAFLWAIVVPVCFIVLAGSEYSSTVNAIIRAVTHIDVRGEISSFVTTVQSLWIFLHQ